MENSIPTERKVEIAQALVKRAIEISGNTPHDVFFEWSPHVDDITISINRNGWERNQKSTTVTVGFGAHNDTEGDYDAIMAILDKLEGK